jgi:hypothetical protein
MMWSISSGKCMLKPECGMTHERERALASRRGVGVGNSRFRIRELYLELFSSAGFDYGLLDDLALVHRPAKGVVTLLMIHCDDVDRSREGRLRITRPAIYIL